MLIKTTVSATEVSPEEQCRLIERKIVSVFLSPVLLTRI